MDASLATAIKKALGTYPLVRDKYYGDVFASVYDFLDTGKRMTSFRNDMRRGMADAFVNAADIAWSDGGGTLPLDEEALSWMVLQQEAEFSFIDILFQGLKDLRKLEGINKTQIATARADGYCRKLDYIYSYIKIVAAGSKMLTLIGEDGQPPKFPCPECRLYKGKRHKASWWKANNLIPGIGSAYSCGGWQCKHVLVDDAGEVWTL